MRNLTLDDWTRISSLPPDMLEGHINRALDGALTALHRCVVDMGSLVLGQVCEAAAAQAEWNLGRAEQVLAREREVSEYSRRVSEEQLKLLARYQPVAGDLRAILAMTRIVSELERAGDEATKIARTIIVRGGKSAPIPSRDVARLAKAVLSLLRSALHAFDRLDAALALDAIAYNKEQLDSAFEAGLQRLVSSATENPRQLDVALDTAFALKSLVRIADHAHNLACYVRSLADPQPAKPDCAARRLEPVSD